MNDSRKIVDRVLALLRQYGWEIGYKKLEAELGAEGDGDDGREVREFFLGWMAAERGNYTEAVQQFEAARQITGMAGWALMGKAFVALREKDFRLAKRLLEEARQPGVEDSQLLATIAHVNGAMLFHQGDSEQARLLLIEAMKLYGPEHFAIGRVLDTLGMIYAGRDNFQGAREFFERALILKRADDLAGLAVTHGQLGRLYLDWGYLEKAQSHFEEDLKIARQIGDDAGKAMMYNFLGQVCTIRGEQEAAVNRATSARREFEAAAGWLESAASLSLAKKWPITEGYARKDQARLALAHADLKAAEVHAGAAREIFETRGFAEGLAHVNRIWGALRCRQGRCDEAMTALMSARRHFEETREPAEVARTLFAIAQVSAAAGEPRPLVSNALLEALRSAESCRRAGLVRKIEAELKAIDPASYYNCICGRMRGRAVTDDAVSLIDGTRESATVLFLDLQGSTELFRFRDPEQMLMTLNEMMANLSSVLRKHDAQVNGFRGDGFIALLRGPLDAVRGVEAALDLHEAMTAFNEPRAILGLPPFVARIGVNSGEMFFGNVGTYDKLDFAAIGTTVNMAARLEAVAEASMPCIGRGTYEKVQQRFRFAGTGPRIVELKGLGPTEAWDVVGRATIPPHESPAPVGVNVMPADGPSTIGPPYAGPAGVLESQLGGTFMEPARFVFRRLNATMWEFAFGSSKTESVGKNLVGFAYLAILVGDPDREVRPFDLLKHGSSAKRAPSDSRDDGRINLADDESADADRTMGHDDKLDDRAMHEYRNRVRQLQMGLKSGEDPEKRQELEFLEAQLRSATRLGGKRVVDGASRLKLDYNAVKKAIDTALIAIKDHNLVELAAHLSSHIELSVKSCRYRNSARLEWEVAQ